MKLLAAGDREGAMRNLDPQFGGAVTTLTAHSATEAEEE